MQVKFIIRTFHHPWNTRWFSISFRLLESRLNPSHPSIHPSLLERSTFRKMKFIAQYSKRVHTLRGQIPSVYKPIYKPDKRIGKRTQASNNTVAQLLWLFGRYVLIRQQRLLDVVSYSSFLFPTPKTFPIFLIISLKKIEKIVAHPIPWFFDFLPLEFETISHLFIYIYFFFS